MTNEEIEYALLDAGIEVQKFNNGIHWRLYDLLGQEYDWWPSKGTFKVVRSREKKRILYSAEEVIDFITKKP